MTLAQRIAFSPSAPQAASALLGIALAVLLLFGLIGLVILVGGQAAPAARAPAASPAQAAPLAKARAPVCATALARARDTRAMSAKDAIAASTAMLRACQVR